MITHSSILAWEIPRTKESGRLQSMGSQESDMVWRLNHQGQRDSNSQMCVCVCVCVCILNRAKYLKSISYHSANSAASPFRIKLFLITSTITLGKATIIIFLAWVISTAPCLVSLIPRFMILAPLSLLPREQAKSFFLKLKSQNLDNWFIWMIHIVQKFITFFYIAVCL